MPRVIVLDTLAQEGLDLLDAAANIEYEVRTGLKGDALRQALTEFDGAICRSGVKITAEALAGNHRLKAIVRAGVGTDNIDKKEATRLGIVVMNTPAGNTISTAEHAFAMMLALSRNIAPAYQSLLEAKWERNKYMGTQLAGKTLGIVGLGRIGQAVAMRAKAFEMRVVGYDPFLPSQRAKELAIETVATVHELLPMVDYLTVHTPLTEQTRSLIGAKEIEMLRPTARLINCARGGIYEEAALAEALKNGRIAGVALDVYEKEPCTNSPLFGMPGVLATPHLGASTEEAQTNVAVEGVGLLVDFLSTGAVRHAVNMTPIDPKTMASLRGYLDVAYRLGLLVAQLDRSAPAACKLSYRGEVTTKETKLITASFAAGLLQEAMAEEVNIVNAEMLLRERGIELTEESRADIGDFSSVITAEVTTESRRKVEASGTLFGKKMPRLVKIDDYNLETYLDGILMVFTHHDVPGIIGKVGSVFGTHRVNIAQMSVGRTSKLPGGMALGVLNLDAEPTAAALDEVRNQPQVESAMVIKLPSAGELPAWLAE